MTVSESGLWLNSQWPYMGASPDGIVVCSCHGTGVCEIKVYFHYIFIDAVFSAFTRNIYIYILFQCPHCHKDKENITDCAGVKGFCLVTDQEDGVKLDKDHAYYYQVQAQLHIMDVEFCDFIVWNENSLFIERILPDVEFWGEVIPKVERFFRHAILPEILGQKFTKQVLPKSLLTSVNTIQSV